MQFVKVYSQNGIGVISMNNPKTLNGLDIPMVENLLEAFKKFGEDKQIKVIMLTSDAKGFCAGGNVAEMFEKIQKGTQADENFDRNIDLLGELVKYIRNVPKPVIAVVNGAAAGAGVSLVMACDFCVAAENAKFIQAFVNVGLVPDTAGLFTLIGALGYKKAIELSMLGEPITAQQAKEIGMINFVTADEDLLNQANNLALKLSNKPVESLKNIKRLTNSLVMKNIDEYLKLEKECMRECIKTNNFIEGVTSFFEKRKPEFNK